MDDKHLLTIVALVLATVLLGRAAPPPREQDDGGDLTRASPAADYEREDSCDDPEAVDGGDRERRAATTTSAPDTTTPAVRTVVVPVSVIHQVVKTDDNFPGVSATVLQNSVGLAQGVVAPAEPINGPILPVPPAVKDELHKLRDKIEHFERAAAVGQ